jgi:hypothetical protein
MCQTIRVTGESSKSGSVRTRPLTPGEGHRPTYLPPRWSSRGLIDLGDLVDAVDELVGGGDDDVGRAVQGRPRIFDSSTPSSFTMELR